MKITNYKELINFLEKIYTNKKCLRTIIKSDDKTFKIYNKKNNVLLLEYEYESDGIKNYLEKILSNNNHIDIEVNAIKSNNYNLICNYLILDFLLTVAKLKHENKDIVHKFKITSKNGKVRDITAPCPEVKVILQKINSVLQKVYDNRNENFQVAYKKGKSIKNNADLHKDNYYIFKIDIHDFFPSCDRDNVKKYIEFLFNNSADKDTLINDFLDNTLENDALYIGSPISGTIANAIISKPVEYMKKMCEKANIAFSVYADDMTFSSSVKISSKTPIAIFNKAFEKYNLQNFTINEKKCIGESGTRRHITGVAINHENKMTCRRIIFSNIRQTLHQLSYDDTSHYDHNHLKGNIAFMMMVDESGKLKKLVEKYEYTLIKYKLMSRENINKIKGV